MIKILALLVLLLMMLHGYFYDDRYWSRKTLFLCQLTAVVLAVAVIWTAP